MTIMTDTTALLESEEFPLPEDAYEVLLVGAGVSVINTLYELRRHGFQKLHVLERGSGLGGTWFWNRYPGARFDAESYTYQFFFDPDLVREWRWKEHFGGQPEIEEYLNHVVDRAGLRDHFEFGVDVASAAWDEASRLWTVRSHDGKEYRSRIVITGVGILSEPAFPKIPGGRDAFRGPQPHTGLWPREGVDIAGKRVAVVGTGSSGIQVIPAIAPDVESMVIFQRTPNWATPLNNSHISDEEYAEILAGIDELHELCGHGFGFLHQFPGVSASDHSAEERRAHFEKLYAARGFAKLMTNYPEVFGDLSLNKEFTDFIAEKIRERVNDPATAEKLIPTDHHYGGKRPPFETDYFEVFNQDNVALVDLREEPIEAVTEEGLRTSEREYPFDVIIWATGFDAITGTLDRIAIRGTETTLKEAWSESPWTHVGSATPGFPNFLMVGGAHTLGGNIPRVLEFQASFIADLVADMRDNRQTRVETTAEAADEWTAHAISTGESALKASHTDYNFGANVNGKKNVFRAYMGGVDGVRGKLEQLRSQDFGGYHRN
jgi:cation diffusion facilitator CzcD-associated flavoprotein CzcO